MVLPLSILSDTSRQDPDLRDYARSGEPEAFRRMVERHLPTVQQAAIRILGPGSGWVDDVSQDVFLLLARKARGLPADTILAAWLYRLAVRKAIDIVRSETRRKKREAIAHASASPAEESGRMWNAIMPRLDRELLRLPDLDQKIVALRFMERCSSDETARRLGLTSAAVRKRLERALSKIRQRLVGPVPGTLTVTALTAYLSVPTAKAAGARQVAAISNHCLSAVALRDASIVTLFFMTKTQILITGSILLVGAAAFVAGRHTVPDTVATSHAPRLTSSSSSADSPRDRTTATRVERTKSADFPATKEGRLALLRVILSNGDAVARNQAFDRFLNNLDTRDYADVSKYLASQEPSSGTETLSISAAHLTLFSFWAQRDPGQAIQMAETLSNNSYSRSLGRETALQTIASVWARENPDAAIDWARKRPGYPWQDEREDPFMNGLVTSVAVRDLGKATRLLEEMSLGPDPRIALGGVVSHLLAGGGDAAFRWVDTLRNEKLKKNAIITVAENMADPASAIAWLTDKTSSDPEHMGVEAVFKKWMVNDSDGAKNHYDSLPPGPLRSAALTAMTHSLFMKDSVAPEDYLWFADRFETASDRSSFPDIFSRWSQDDRPAAIQRFTELPRETAADVSRSIVTQMILDSHGDEALNFVRDHLDRISENAIMQVVLQGDEATADAVVMELESRRPDLVPKMRNALASRYFPKK